jgi:hypothetical protein
MTKEQRSVVVEYVSSLSEEELRFLSVRLTERLSGDLAEALNMMSKSPRMDTILSSAGSADEVFTICDQIREVLAKECKKKGVGLKQSPVAA